MSLRDRLPGKMTISEFRSLNVIDEKVEDVMTVQQQKDLGQQALRALERNMPLGGMFGEWVAYQGKPRLAFRQSNTSFISTASNED